MKRNVDYPTYEGKYDEGIKNMMAKDPNQETVLRHQSPI